MAFTIFQVANRSNKTLTNPVTRVATALTYMDGPLIDPWKEDQLQKLEARITAGTADTNEAHWTTFKQDFEDAFGNTNERQDSLLRSKTLNGTTCAIWLQRFWSSIIEGDADCDSNRRPKANP